MNIEKLIGTFVSNWQSPDWQEATYILKCNRWQQLRALGYTEADVLRYDKQDARLIMKDGRRLPF